MPLKNTRINVLILQNLKKMFTKVVFNIILNKNNLTRIIKNNNNKPWSNDII